MRHPFSWPYSRALLVACLTVFCLMAPAAPSRAEEVDNQQWSVITLDKEFSKRWRGSFELQSRFGEDMSRPERLIIRAALGYRLNQKWSVWQGYGWTPQIEPDFNNEHRPFQQLLFEDTLGKTRVTGRGRLEERFIEGVDDTELRLRGLVRLRHPISADHRWEVVGSDELFWNLNSTSGPVSGYDQNRLFLGISRQLNPEVRVETGYLWNHVNLPRTSENRRLNVWVVQLAVRL